MDSLIHESFPPMGTAQPAHMGSQYAANEVGEPGTEGPYRSWNDNGEIQETEEQRIDRHTNPKSKNLIPNNTERYRYDNPNSGTWIKQKKYTS